MMKRALLWASMLIAIFYPVVVYFGIQLFDARWLALVLFSILVARLVLQTSPFPKTMKLVLGASCLILLTSVTHNTSFGIKAYPILINLGLLAIFALSLRQKQSMIERLARLKEPDLPERGVHYTRKVTKVWCVFFAVNATISAYTAAFLTWEAWTFYNGFIAYIAIGCLFAGEWLVRQIIKIKEA